MKRILSAAIVFLAASLSAQVQIGRNVQIGGASGGGTGTVTSVSTAGYPSPFGTVVITFSTTTPLITFTAPTYSQNQFLAGPTSGSGNPTARAIVPGDVPTLNQNTTGTASNLSGTPALPNGTTATTQSPGDNTTKLATDAFVLANAGSGAVSSVSNSDSSLTVTPTTGAVVASINPAHANTWTAPQTFAGSGPPISIPANKATSPSAGTGQFGTDASGNLVSSDNNAAQARVCNATNGVCSGASFPSGNVGQILSNTTGSTTYAAQGQLVYQQSGDTIVSIEANAQCATACTYVVTGPQTLTLTGNHTMAAPVRIRFEAGGLWTVNGAFTLTFSSTPTSSSLTQHFAGSSTLAGFSGSIPVEWFGALGFTGCAAAASGTDYTTQIQKTLNSITGGGWAQLQPLCYQASGGLGIHVSSVGIHGTLPRDNTVAVFFPGQQVSAIVNDTSVNTLTVSGTGPGNSQILAWNTFQDFSLERQNIPTGTVPTAGVGFYLQYTGGVQRHHVASNDSLAGFWHNSDPFDGTGEFAFDKCGWSLTFTTQNLTCEDIDSGNGDAMNTALFNTDTVSGNGGTSGVVTGFKIHGTAINDVNLFKPICAGGVSICVDIENEGATTSDNLADIHVDQITCDSPSISCIKINNLDLLSAQPSVTIDLGYMLVNSDSLKTIDCENSVGVLIIANQFLTIGPVSDIGVYENGCSGGMVVNNLVHGFNAGTFLQFVGTTNTTVLGNNVKGNPTTAPPMTVAFTFDSGSVLNDVGPNTVGVNVTAPYGGSTPIGTSPSYFGDVYSNGSLLTGSSFNGGTITNPLTINTSTLGAINIGPSSGTDNNTISFGPTFGADAIDLYASGSTKYGWGLAAAEMQFFVPNTSAHFSYNAAAGGLQTSGVNEYARLTPGIGYTITSGETFGWASTSTAAVSADTGLSRDAAGVVDVGNGTAGDKSGAIKLSNLTDSALTTNPTCAVSGLLADCSTTGTGSSVRATSPTLVTPALGTPSAVVLTNGTGLPAASVLSGALANGMTATTQTVGDNTTKLATDAFVLANTVVYPGAGIPKSTGSAWGTSYTATGTGASVATASGGLNNGHLVSWITAGGGVDATDSGLIAPIVNAITTATGGSGTGTVTCATATCTNQRGSYTVGGGTFATGTLLALVWPTTTNAYVCWATVLNNATGASIGYHSIATATGMNITSLTAATGLSVDIDYGCTP